MSSKIKYHKMPDLNYLIFCPITFTFILRLFLLQLFCQFYICGMGEDRAISQIYNPPIIMQEAEKKDLSEQILQLINGIDLKRSEEDITTVGSWTTNLEDINNKLISFEFVNKSSTNLWISLLNGNKFLMPKELLGSPYTNLNYTGAATILTDKSSPVFIYIWLTEPQDPLVKSRVNKPDIIYKISTLTRKTLFLSWNKTLEPQTGGGLFGINNLTNTAKLFIGFDYSERTSYYSRKKFDINTNVQKKDIELLEDTRVKKQSEEEFYLVDKN